MPSLACRDIRTFCGYSTSDPTEAKLVRKILEHTRASPDRDTGGRGVVVRIHKPGRVNIP